MENSKIYTALIGQELHDGWVIEEPRSRIQGATGSCNCIAFLERSTEGKCAFVKILDPTPDENLESDAALLDLQRRLEIFNYERDLNKCLSRKIRRVVKAIGHEC